MQYVNSSNSHFKKGSDCTYFWILSWILSRYIISIISNSRHNYNDYNEIEYNTIARYCECKRNSAVFQDRHDCLPSVTREDSSGSDGREKGACEREKSRKAKRRNRIELFRWCINHSRCNVVLFGRRDGCSWRTLNQILIKRNCEMIFHYQLYA